MGEQDFSVLVVCHANLCRSPLVEHLLREESGRRDLPWSVRSTGTHAVGGRPMHRHAERLLRHRGHDVRDWTTRPLAVADLEAADLVLTATQAERETVSRLVPGTNERTHTLSQLAYLRSAVTTRAEVSPAEFGPWLVETATEMRTRVQPLPPARRDLRDPMGRMYPAFLACATRVERSLQQILEPVPRRHWDWDLVQTTS